MHQANSSHDLRKTVEGISTETFRRVGHELVDTLADFLANVQALPVTSDPQPAQVRSILGPDKLDDDPVQIDGLIRDMAQKLIHNSLHNGHPRFWAYITSAADPAGILADFLASAMNPNTALWHLAPMATEIELQAIRWIADLIGYPRNCGGILVSGGNMANFVCFLAARRAKANWPIGEDGLAAGAEMTLYVSAEAHTWVDKAADLFGLGAKSVRWIDVDERLRMRVDVLRETVRRDREAGLHPFMVVATAGTVGTGAVDPLGSIADLCDAERLWFHVDGAYGALAASLPDAPSEFNGIDRADSIALDPHKWLRTPLEAGCALVRRLEDLERTFSHKPFYLMTGEGGHEEPASLVERGPQNSRGFRALKVWLGIRVAGRSGIVRSIGQDIALSKYMASCLAKHPEIEVTSQSLSITTFRYVPGEIDQTESRAYLNALNERLLRRLQSEGNVFPSQANIAGNYVLRACIVNFRTTASDVEMLPELVVEAGSELHRSRREWWTP